MLKTQVKRQKLLEKQLENISFILTNRYDELLDVGVLTGSSGVSLFHFYYSKYLDIDAPAITGAKIISECIDKINNGYSYPTYCSGIAGLGWLLDHLNQEGLVEIDADNLLSEMDQYLYKIMIDDIKNGNYDFLHGAIGYGYYFLKRYKNTTSQVLKKRYITYLIDLIENLKIISEIDINGYKWGSILNKEEELKGYNLSLSHGMSSIINFLSRLYLYSEFKEKTSPILLGGISYLLSCENLDKSSISIFPSWISEPIEMRPSRLAWCYGDLGIGLSLRMAAQVLKDQRLEKKALWILRHAAKRRTIEETLIKDTGICHGTYGNAQIFNRLYKDTQDDIFYEASSHWIDKGLSMATFSDGYAGYKQWNGEKGWGNEMNFLEGIAGIGTTIIFYLSDFETNWDECLMIS